MGKKNNTKVKGTTKKDSLYLVSRWKKEPFSITTTKIIDTKAIPKDTPAYESKFDLRHINLRKRELEGVNLHDGCLHSINAYQVQLIKCEILRCYTKKGDFAESRIESCKFNNSIFSGTSFLSAGFDQVNMEDGIFENCQFNGATFKHVFVENAIFDNSNFTDLLEAEAADFVGVPKSAKGVVIDATTYEKLKESPLKALIYTQGIVNPAIGETEALDPQDA